MNSICRTIADFHPLSLSLCDWTVNANPYNWKRRKNKRKNKTSVDLQLGILRRAPFTIASPYRHPIMKTDSRSNLTFQWHFPQNSHIATHWRIDCLSFTRHRLHVQNYKVDRKFIAGTKLADEAKAERFAGIECRWTVTLPATVIIWWTMRYYSCPGWRLWGWWWCGTRRD